MIVDGKKKVEDMNRKKVENTKFVYMGGEAMAQQLQGLCNHEDQNLGPMAQSRHYTHTYSRSFDE